MPDTINGMILAAGLGTRLGKLGTLLPKPAFPVAGTALVSWVSQHMASHGVTRQCINLHNQGEAVRRALDATMETSSTSPPHDLRFSDEQPNILGTGGGIKKMAAMLPSGPALVANGKIISDIDLAAVVAAHHSQNNVATMVVCACPNPRAWGAIGVRDGRVVEMLDQQQDTGGTPYMFTGVHVLSPALLESIPDGPCCIIRTAYLDALRAGARIGAVIHNGYFHEHSTPARYLLGCLNVMRGLAGDTVAIPNTSEHATIDASATVHRGASVAAGAQIEAGATIGSGVYIGAGARVLAGVHVDNSVVWRGAVVDADLNYGIAAAGGITEKLDAATLDAAWDKPR